MSGPIGSAYPGNFVISILAVIFALVFVKSVRTAYARQREDSGMKSWKPNAGMAIIALGAMLFALYAIWVHR